LFHDSWPDPFDLYGEAVVEEVPPATSRPAGGRSPGNRPREIGSKARVQTSEGDRPGRIVALDACRGWALVYMLCSHTALGVLGWMWWPRGLGWALFVVVAGSLWRPRLGKRYLQIVYGGVASMVPAVAMGLAFWNILLGWAVVLPVAFFLRRLPTLWLVVVAVQIHWLWPIGGSPGLVMLAWLIGRTLGPSALGSSLAWVPSPRWLLWLSRYPLSVYVGHLWVLALVARSVA